MSDVKKLVDRANALLGKRFDLLQLWQTIADNFYVERATFTVTREMGAEFADHLMTSYPLMVRRDLGNQFSGMLRPTSKDWFKMSTERAQTDLQARAWLEYATGVQKRAMYDRKARFVRATKEGDHDFAAFGQCVISVEKYQPPDIGRQAFPPHLLYRCWHLRDCAWAEDVTGEVNTFVRKWKPSLMVLNQKFPGKLSPKRMQQLEKDPLMEVECLHIVVPADTYDCMDGKKYRTRYVSVYVDIDEQTALEEVGQRSMMYVVPRWQTVSDSQYAYSPATVCALPDARLLQAMTLTLLEAGEKAVNPPMVGVQTALRSDLNLFAGGFTAVDAAYDERLGEVLRPLTSDKSGLPYGIEVRDDIKASLMDAFFLNKLNLPPVDTAKMTAYEVSQRVSEYIRQALPLFEPLESDYNGALCERTFDILMQDGAFGPVDTIPEALSEEEVTFRFESPLQEAVERQKATIFMEGQGLVAQAVQVDQTAVSVINAPKALREALLGIGMSPANIRSEEEIDEIVAAEEQKAQAAQLLQGMQAAADVAKTAGEAAGAFQV
jgi:hypothetical protein